MKRDEKLNGYYHERLKRDVEALKTYIEGLSTCVDYGNKGNILDEIKDIKKYLKLVEEAVKDAN